MVKALLLNEDGQMPCHGYLKVHKYRPLHFIPEVPSKKTWDRSKYLVSKVVQLPCQAGLYLTSLTYTISTISKKIMVKLFIE